MLNAQTYINALRNQDYFKVLELSDFVANKYSKINMHRGRSTPVGADELVTLMIYELCQTDINDDDIEKINFLLSYINYNDPISRGVYGYRAVNFSLPVSMALAAKKTPGFAQAMAVTEIKNHRQYKVFHKSESVFSRFLDSVDCQNEASAISTPLNEEMLVKKFAAMPPEANNLFLTKVNHMREHEGIEVDCPFIKSLELKQVINALLHHLEGKLFAQGVIVSQRTELSAKQELLVNRYTAIYELRNYCQDKVIFTEDDKAKVREIVGVCLANRPSWFERTFVEKISYILTLGLRPLYKHFFSIESNYEKYLEDVVTTTAPPVA